MKKIFKRLTSVVLSVTISLSMVTAVFAQEYLDENDTLGSDNLEQELGYIPDAGLGTPAEFPVGLERNFGSMFYQYPNGSYFSKTGKACTCHNGNCDLTYKGNCDCICFENSIQCMAFGRKLYYEVHGYSLNSHLIEKEMLFKSGEQAKQMFNRNNTTPEAIYLRVGTVDDINNHANDHSLVIVFSSASAVAVYHANYGGHCLVRYETYTWDNFVKAFPCLRSYAF